MPSNETRCAYCGSAKHGLPQCDLSGADSFRLEKMRGAAPASPQETPPAPMTEERLGQVRKIVEGRFGEVAPIARELLAEVTRLRASVAGERETARLDTERLDWLDMQGDLTLESTPGAFSLRFKDFWRYGMTVRECVDRARRVAPPGDPTP